MRSRIESALEGLGRRIHRSAWTVIVGLVLLVALLASQVSKIEIRTSTDEFLRPDDPVRVEYDAFLERFGRDDMILVAIEAEDVFDRAFLERLRDFHDAVEDRMPHVRDVQSLINARETRGDGQSLIVGELLEDWPDDASELAAIRDRALANPLYEGMLISENGRLTTVTIELEAFSDFFESDDALSGFESEPEADGSVDEATIQRLTGAQESEAVAALSALIADFDSPDFMLHGGGTPVLNTALMVSLVTDIVLFTCLSTLLIAVFLVVVFRRALGVIIPLSVALLSLAATVGLMGTLGIPAMPISEVVPSFLLSIGVGSSVHLIAIFLQRVEAGSERGDAIAGALGHSGLPIIMTSLTTAGGIASFATADMLPVAIFGVVAPLGILVTLVFTLLLCPAILSVIPVRGLDDVRARPDPAEVTTAEPPSIRLLAASGRFATARPGLILGTSATLVALAIIGMLRLQVSFDSLEWFPDDLPAKVASKKLDEHFGGSVGLELLVDTGRVNGLHEPAVLQAMARSGRAVSGLQVGDIIAGKSISLADVVEEIHQALNEGRADARVIPNDARLVAQELILFENSGSDDLEDVVDSDFRLGRVTVRVPMADGSQYPAFGAEVARLFAANLPEPATASLTGMIVVMGRSFTASIETMMRSYSIALVVITPLMMLLLGSFRLGLIAMIPNLFPIVLTLGLMGWLDIPLEMFTLLIGSVALGLAVDDTIHFMHGFRRSHAESGSVERAVDETLRTTGQALLFTSIVLSTGFMIYVLSDLNNLTRFGILTAFSIVMAFLADILLAPALMKVATRFSSLGVKTPKDAPSPAPGS